jgi:hypothetical protein
VHSDRGRVHAIPATVGNNRNALCGEMAVSGRNAVVGIWRSTDDAIDCQRCLKRLEGLADAFAEQNGRQALRLDWSDFKVRNGVCPICGRVRRVLETGVMGSHTHVTNQAWKKDDRCLGVGRVPAYLAVPVPDGVPKRTHGGDVEQAG